MRGQLLVIAGPDQGRIFSIQDGQAVLIGRGQSTETKLKDPQVSRVHCEVLLRSGRLHLTDSGSSTGTLVNQKRVVRHELSAGDVIQIGGTVLRFELEGIPDAATVVLSELPSGALPLSAPPEAIHRHLKSHVEQGVLVLALVENQILDDAVAEAVRLELLMALAQSRARKVVLDFHGVKSVSSAIFRPLLSLQGRLTEQGGHLVLCAMTGLVAQVFRMTGLIVGPSAPFTAEDDVTAAVARLNQ